MNSFKLIRCEQGWLLQFGDRMAPHGYVPSREWAFSTLEEATKFIQTKAYELTDEAKRK